MRKNNIPILLSMLSLVLVTSGVFLGLIDNFKLDKHNTIEIENKINLSYNEITQKMDNLHTSMLEMQDFFSMYYENIDENKNLYDNKLNNIKALKNDINNSIANINDLCSNPVNNTTRRQCEALYRNNDSINDNYQELEESYNSFINKHNEWLVAYAN